MTDEELKDIRGRTGNCYAMSAAQEALDRGAALEQCRRERNETLVELESVKRELDDTKRQLAAERSVGYMIRESSNEALCKLAKIRKERDEAMLRLSEVQNSLNSCLGERNEALDQRDAARLMARQEEDRAAEARRSLEDTKRLVDMYINERNYALDALDKARSRIRALEADLGAETTQGPTDRTEVAAVLEAAADSMYAVADDLRREERHHDK